MLAARGPSVVPVKLLWRQGVRPGRLVAASLGPLRGCTRRERLIAPMPMGGTLALPLVVGPLQLAGVLARPIRLV